MKPLFWLAYLFVSFFVVRILLRDERFPKFPQKQRTMLILGSFLLPLIFFTPYAFDFVPAQIPDGFSYLPFFLIAAGGMIVQTFFPSRVKEWTPLFLKIMVGTIGLLFFLPFLIGIFQRLWGR